MPMIEQVRPATEGDLAELVRLEAGARAELSEERGGPLWSVREARRRPVASSFSADLDDPDALVVVGCLDEAVVGYGVARVEPLADGRVLGVVADVVVEPGAREVGVGELLLTEMVAWCADRGCVGIDAFALPGARETKNFFEGHGFSARALILHRPIRPGDGT